MQLAKSGEAVGRARAVRRSNALGRSKIHKISLLRVPRYKGIFQIAFFSIKNSRFRLPETAVVLSALLIWR
ncbi:hypothetical protein HMPREF2541_08365 [Eikenella sp. HMSC061C02]|nr:hypothetical protein A7P84_03620 [Eikenella corrodens]OFN60268.1 hypothetical protein HMPREF2541_08365 [Eikenella sp. HMSC061C02]OWP27838.1 hypothetical protein CA838_06200 [Eikenella corrodens]